MAKKHAKEQAKMQFKEHSDDENCLSEQQLKDFSKYLSSQLAQQFEYKQRKVKCTFCFEELQINNLKKHVKRWHLEFYQENAKPSDYEAKEG